MVWRAARAADIPPVERLLRQHLQSSMFLLGNLKDPCNGQAMDLWVQDDLSGVVGLTEAGMVLMQAPHAPAEDWQAASVLLAGRSIAGCAGNTAQLRAFLAASDFVSRPTRLDEDEPGFSLDLDQLEIPKAEQAALIPLATAPRDLVLDWRAAYHREVLATGADVSEERAAQDIASYLDRDSHRVLSIAGQPVAMTGFNAQIPEVVQIGGVYTPPGLRGRGLARLAVALHLDEARKAGAQRAVLFAASPAAARAYEAIGFRPAGSFSLVLFAPEQEVP
jgi:RimJ/RimL family protein N-acetyltransferase